MSIGQNFLVLYVLFWKRTSQKLFRSSSFKNEFFFSEKKANITVPVRSSSMKDRRTVLCWTLIVFIFLTLLVSVSNSAVWAAMSTHLPESANSAQLKPAPPPMNTLCKQGISQFATISITSMLLGSPYQTHRSFSLKRRPCVSSKSNQPNEEWRRSRKLHFCLIRIDGPFANNFFDNQVGGTAFDRKRAVVCSFPLSFFQSLYFSFASFSFHSVAFRWISIFLTHIFFCRLNGCSGKCFPVLTFFLLFQILFVFFFLSLFRSFVLLWFVAFVFFSCFPFAFETLKPIEKWHFAENTNRNYNKCFFWVKENLLFLSRKRQEKKLT